MIPKISIIIPCFNHGIYIQDALDSVLAMNFKDYEIIIIDDGSTDDYTIEKLADLQIKGFRVIKQVNQGLSAARNTGIRHASACFILTLDSDNKIRENFILKALEAMQQDDRIVVAYGNAQLFGDQNEVWTIGDFNLQRLMISNYIDACAVIRKDVFEKLGGYDTSMRAGLEDWELWLRIAFSGNRFFYIDEVVFDYRVLSSSMSKSLLKQYEKRNSIESYIHQKYPEYMGHSWIVNHYVKRFRAKPVIFVIKLLIITYFPMIYDRLLKKNKITNGL